MKNAKRMIALVLALVLAVSVFTACGEKKDEKKDEAAITATAVKFSKDGKYTTTVKSDTVDLSKVSAKNVEVSYTDYNEVVSDDTVNTAITKDKKTNEPETVKVKVESVKANSNGGYDITFTDKNAASNPTSYYAINLVKQKTTVSADVDFPEITLTPDVKSVVSSDKNVKVTLALEGSEFESGIDKKDIYLGNAFKRMSIKSVSASDKNLTVQLKGSPVRNVAGAYQWGSVNVRRSVIKDGYADVTAKVDVQIDSAYINPKTLKLSGGKINAELKVYGVADVNKLTKANVKIDGASVEAVEKKDDNTAGLALSAKSFKSVNDFVDKVTGKEMTIDGYKTDVALSQADFYPIFDYVEEDGKNLKLALNLAADSGVFDKNLKADSISFADDFEKAKVESVKLDNDTLATLILSVPANGQTDENFKMNGTVKLAAGSMTNEWGEKTSNESVYTRDYSGETLGKEVSLNTDTLLEIQKYTRGLDTFFGKICYYGQMAATVFSLSKTALEATGALQSDHEQVMEQLKQINLKLDEVNNGIQKIRSGIRQLKDDNKQILLKSYRDNFKYLNKKLRDVLSTYKLAATDMLEKYPQYKDVKVDDMSDEDVIKYNTDLIAYIFEREKDEEDEDYCHFSHDFEELRDTYEKITGYLADSTDQNPIRLIDDSCALTYNFDTQCYDYRLGERIFAETQLTKVLAALAVRYNPGKKSNEYFTNALNDYKEAFEEIDKLSLTPTKEKFIGEIKLAGSDKSARSAKNILEGEGYTPIDTNLYNGSEKLYLYLGYKMTTDAKEAITMLCICADKFTTDTLRPNKTWKRCEYKGTDKFAEGDLNAGKDYTSYLLYNRSFYMGALKEIYLDNNNNFNADIKYDNYFSNGSVKIVSDSTAVSKHSPNLYLHVETDYVLSIKKQTTPYCYVLGSKVKTNDSSGSVEYYMNHGAIKNGSNYRDWTVDEQSDFASRMHYNTLKEELKSAGIDSNYGLLMSLSSQKGSSYYNQWTTWSYVNYTGNVLKNNSNKVTNEKLAYYETARTDGKSKAKNKYMDTVSFELVK